MLKLKQISQFRRKFLCRTFCHAFSLRENCGDSPNRKKYFLNLLKSCLNPSNPLRAKQVHTVILKSGFRFDSHICTALIDTYSKLGFVNDARILFDEILLRDIVLWNVMITCYSTNGFEIAAFRLFNYMRNYGFICDEFTLSILIRACNSLNYKFGQAIHSLVINSGIDNDIVVSTSLIDMYSKHGQMEDARKVFDDMQVKNLISWNTLIIGYGKNYKVIEAMKLLIEMIKEGLKPDELIFSSILSSCGHKTFANETIQIHSHALKNGCLSFISVLNALILAYAKNGFIKNALQIFRFISKPDLITWSCIISSCAYHGFHLHALDMFDEMLQRGVKPDKIAFLGVLSACAHAGLVELGLKYFVLMKEKYRIIPNSEHYACLVDLFGRAGEMENAYYLLDKMSIELNGDILGAFMSACKEQGNFEMAKRVVNKIFNLEPNKPVNYIVLSNLYSDIGNWDNVANTRNIMRGNVEKKVPGFSGT